jgi:hypothetical protein
MDCCSIRQGSLLVSVPRYRENIGHPTTANHLWTLFVLASQVGPWLLEARPLGSVFPWIPFEMIE